MARRPIVWRRLELGSRQTAADYNGGDSVSAISLGRVYRPRRGRTVMAAVIAALVVAWASLRRRSGLRLHPVRLQQVGQTYASGVLLPTNQWNSPFGTRILDNQERLVSSTISPDGTYLAALGWNEFSGYLTIFDLKTGKVVQNTGAGGPARRTRAAGLRSAARRPVLFPRTARRCGSRSRPTCCASRSTPTARPRRPPRSRCAADADLVRQLQRELRTDQRRGRLPPVRHGAVAGWQQAVRRAQRHQHAGRDRYREQPARGADPGRQRAASGRAGRRRHGRLRLKRGRAPRAARRLHQPLRRHADRRQQGHRRRDHRHRLGGQPDDRQGDARRSRSACSRPRSTRTARRCSSPTQTTTASR